MIKIISWTNETYYNFLKIKKIAILYMKEKVICLSQEKKIKSS